LLSASIEMPQDNLPGIVFVVNRSKPKPVRCLDATSSNTRVKRGNDLERDGQVLREFIVEFDEGNRGGDVRRLSHIMAFDKLHEIGQSTGQVTFYALVDAGNGARDVV
jgi:hypothetical protein